MRYTSSSHINTMKDVEAFFHHILHERKLYGFHPDDMFESNVSCEGGNNGLSIAECSIYNRLMDECFKVCKVNGVDVYAIGE